jgi:GH43 family beta-xylosidase
MRHICFNYNSVRTSTLYRYKVILSEIKIVSTLSRDEIKPVKAIKNLKNWKRWTCWKFWKKKSLIFSLWAHQMKIIEDHIVFIKIFSCSKLKTALWASYPNQTFKLSNHSNICLFEWFETGLISSLVDTSSETTELILFSFRNQTFLGLD